LCKYAYYDVENYISCDWGSLKFTSKPLRRDGQRNYVITVDRPSDQPTIRPPDTWCYQLLSPPVSPAH